jgi:hypothetical protein
VKRLGIEKPREPGAGAASEIRGQGELDPVIVPIGGVAIQTFVEAAIREALAVRTRPVR